MEILKSQLLGPLLIVLGTILLIYQYMVSPNYHRQVNPKPKTLLVDQTEVENLGILLAKPNTKSMRLKKPSVLPKYGPILIPHRYPNICQAKGYSN
jgi:hypothetical protein